MANQKNIKNVKDLSDKLSKAKSIYFTDYLCLNVSDVTSLRKKFFESNDEPVIASKIIKDFLKDHDLPIVKGVLFDGSYLPASDFEKISRLPSKEESLTKFVVMLKSPVQNIVNLLNSPMVKLVNVLGGLKENKR